MKLYSFLNPKSVAIIGASDKPGKIGNILLRNLVDLRFEGRIFPVNPKHTEILGVRCFKKITDIQQEIDLVVVAVPAALVYEVILEASGRSRNFVVISAGFSEIGKTGQVLEKKLLKLAQENDLNILGPNCLGILNPSLKLNASFSSGLPESGNVAFLSQSGALAVALIDEARTRKMGFSKIVSLGNKMQIGENELLEFIEEDTETKVVGLYLESLRDGGEFLRIASRISEKKPIVILRSGKSSRAKEAMLSHTGSLAGESSVAEEAFRKSGIIEARSSREFMNILEMMSKISPLEKGRSVILTNAGGPGVLATDSFQDSALELFEISEESRKEFSEFLPQASSLGNPIDILGDALEDRYQKALETLEKEKDIDSLFIIATPQDQTPIEKIAQAIGEFSRKTKKAVIPVFMGGKKSEKAGEILRELRLPVFNYPEEAVESLSAYRNWQNSSKNIFEGSLIDEERRRSAREVIEKAKLEGRKMLNAFEAGEILSLYGIFSSEAFRADGQGFDFPVVLKVDSDKIVHKTEEGGVIVDIRDQEELEREIGKMKEKFPGANLIVQKQEEKGEEIILGLKRDRAFGAVAVYGLGGVLAEAFQKVDFIFSGMEEGAIEKAVLDGPLAFMFRKFREMEVLDSREFVRILKSLSDLGQELPEIKEMDINPLFGYRGEGRFVAVDTKIII